MKKRKSQELCRDIVLNMAYKTLQKEPEDEFTIFGHHVGNTLRNMTKRQKLIAQKIINETLFYGELDQLTIQSAAQFTTNMQHLNVQQSYGNNTYATPSPFPPSPASVSGYNNYDSTTMSSSSSSPAALGSNTASDLWSM
jgi:hypothetical protein